MTTIYSISEAKSKLSYIGRNVKKNEDIAVLKNGKPVFNIISPEDYKEYKKLLLEKKIEEWDKTLEWEEISEEDARSIAEARKEMKNEPLELYASAQDLINALK